MSKSQMAMDVQMPNLKDGKDVDEKFGMVSDYLFQLAEQQRYLLANLDARNFNPSGLMQIAKEIRQPILIKLEDAQQNMTELKVTVDGISSKVSDLQERSSAIEQKVDSITLSVSNGDTSSMIQLKAGGTVISSERITMKGLVSFEALSQEGQTTINGSNITTGTLRAEFVKLGGKFEVYSGDKMGGYIGYMSGSTGSQATDGIGICNKGSTCYVIATDAGVAIKAKNNTLVLTDGGASLSGPLVINGRVVVNNTVTAFDFIKS